MKNTYYSIRVTYSDGKFLRSQWAMCFASLLDHRTDYPICSAEFHKSIETFVIQLT